MTVADASRVLVELRALGVRVEVVGGSLRFAPAGAVSAPLRKRLAAEKPGVLALLHQEAFAAGGGDGDNPSLEKCMTCGQRDFVRPRAGGAWRCARCRPYDLPAAEVEWWPRVELEVPFDSSMMERAVRGPVGAALHG